MSHFAQYDCKVSRLDFVKSALEEMGYGYKENVIISTSYGEDMKVTLGVARDGKLLPIGFTRNEEDNELELTADWWNLGIEQKEFTDTLSQLHDKYTVLEACEENNWEVEEEDITVNKKGEIEIIATQFA